MQQQPVIILRQNVDRTQGYEAQRSNIAAAKAIAEAVRSTLGPRGMDKMLVDGTGDVVITNDGITILDEISVKHPGAKMVIEVSRTQEETVGDGTTTAVVLVGALMEQAELMLNRQIHPSVISRGFNMGMKKALEIVDEMASEVDPFDRDTLLKITSTAMTGKSVEGVKDTIGAIAVDAVMTVAKRDGNEVSVNEEDVQIKKHLGASMDDAELIRGILIDKKRVNSGMPKSIPNAKIALIVGPLAINKTEVKSKIKINTTEQLQAFSDQENQTLKAMADDILASGANVVFCQKGIADPVQYYLAKAGVLACEDVPESDLKFAVLALGATIVNKPSELTPADLGEAERAYEFEDSDMVRVDGCKNPKAVTILLRGTSHYLVDELDRALVDGIRVVMDVMEDAKFVPGGAAVETELAIRLREYAVQIGGREQLAIEGYAESFSIIPLTLAENSGLNQIDKLVELKQAHAKGEKNIGLNVYTGELVDMVREGVLEPLRSKRQSIKSSEEVVNMLIRIDDMMVSKGLSDMSGPAL